MAEINEYALCQIDRIKETCERIKPIVVIQCTAYNHEAYIKDALEGFVMQKTDFPFVAIVHDDASTDKTAEIINKYAKTYPDIILPIFEKENQYTKKNLGSVMNEASFITGAKYIAICEGDDYWTDPHKLQKQVNILEIHPEYSMCFHKASIKYEKPSTPDKTLEYNYANLKSRVYTIDEIHKTFIVPTCSVLFRASIYDKYISDSDYCVGDNVLWTVCASCGQIYCLSDTMSEYRINNNGWVRRNEASQSIRIKKYKKWYNHYRALRKNYPEIQSTQIFYNEIKYAAIITYTDIKPLKKIVIHFYKFSKLYGNKYLKIFFYNLFCFLKYKISNLLKISSK